MTQTAGFKFIPTNLAGVQLGGDVRLKQGLPDAPRLGVGGEEGGDTAGAPRCPKQRSHSRSTVPYTVLKNIISEGKYCRPENLSFRRSVTYVV